MICVLKVTALSYLWNITYQHTYTHRAVPSICNKVHHMVSHRGTQVFLPYQRPNLHAYQMMFFQQLLFGHTTDESLGSKTMRYKAKIKPDPTYQSQHCNFKV